MILSVNQPHLTEDKIAVISDHFAISCIQYLVTPATFTQFQVFVQLKSQEMEVTGTVEVCNFLSSQETTGGDYQLTTNLYLPKGCSLLDTACLEATSINDLVINSTQSTQQRQNIRGSSRDNNKKKPR